ncbi:MAG: site-specific integrase, partial [Bacteroidia bacterium]|nr:site-specific integrase [Bacteroidia bacterium]
MASIRAVLDTRRMKSNGTYPLKIRACHNFSSKYINLSISIYQRYWNKKKQQVKDSHPNSIKINKLILRKKMSLEERVLDLYLQSNSFSIDDITENNSKIKKSYIPSFKEFGYELVNGHLNNEKVGTARSYKNAIDQLCNRFNDKVKLHQINYKFLLKYEQLLSKDGVSVNGIANYMRHLKAIINAAIKSGYLKREDYPFHHYKIRTEKTRKRALSKDDFQKLIALKLPEGSNESEARDYFILIFCLIGANWIDISYLKPEDLKEDRITYKRRKTKKLYDIPLSPKAKELIDKLRLPSSKYLLPILPDSDLSPLDERTWTDNKLRLCNKYLKTIGKECKLQYPLTTYVARHSWATTAKHLGFSNELIAEALGHDYGLNVTNIYLDN